MRPILVKLGGSVLTYKKQPFSLRKGAIEMLTDQIAQVWEDVPLILGHGGGSFPHLPAKKYKVNEGIGDNSHSRGFGLAITQHAAAILNRVLVHALLSRNIPAFTLQPSAALLTARKKIKEWFLKPLKELLRLNMVPVIYGDAVIDVTQGSAILSTEMLFFYIVSKIEIKKVIVVGIEDGVYSSDGTVIPEITPKNIDYITPHLKASQGIDITGGMFHKVYELLKISKKGPICQIINGLKKDTLKNAILEKCNEGTVIKHI